MAFSSMGYSHPSAQSLQSIGEAHPGRESKLNFAQKTTEFRYKFSKITVLKSSKTQPKKCIFYIMHVSDDSVL